MLEKHCHINVIIHHFLECTRSYSELPTQLFIPYSFIIMYYLGIIVS